ncbi:MAG: glycosyltransferase [Eubacteriales bacterium]|nr:glycosyltransferase [Eubacteriales bacterium]
MKYFPDDHTFAVCAYKESPYLEDCICSLLRQSVRSHIILCTSTPNQHIEHLAKQYNIMLYVNQESQGIASDWNFAYHAASTSLVTLAHQDDIYEPDYAKEIISQLNCGGMTQIAFTDYYEIQNGKRVDSKQFVNLRIKKILLAPMRIRMLQSNIWVRRRILSLGNPIGCPSVTYVKDHLPDMVFDPGFASNIDWMAWEQLSKRKGRFLYVPRTLMGHRMYADSTTVKMINTDGQRTKEDYEMLKRFWPKPIASVICKMYAKSQNQRMDPSSKNEKRDGQE